MAGNAKIQGERVAVVSGAASGIGRATCVELRALGWKVAGIDLDPAPDADLALVADITREDAVRTAVAEAARTLGPASGLANCAGIAGFGKVHETDITYWNHVLTVHVTGTMLLSKHCLPAMLAAGRGAIVNVASVYGMTGSALNTPYGVAKGAIMQLTRCMAADYSRAGIRVNTVSPGYVDTPMASVIDKEGAAYRAFIDMHLLGRGGQQEEIANVIAFLLGDGAAFIAGANIPVDGGLTAAQVISDYDAVAGAGMG